MFWVNLYINRNRNNALVEMKKKEKMYAKHTMEPYTPVKRF